MNKTLNREANINKIVIDNSDTPVCGSRWLCTHGCVCERRHIYT